jgi:alkylation response protein AidB-like acyl-CoA dehydrogenase
VDFSLTGRQEQIRGTVRDFAESQILPHVGEWDEAARFPTEIIPKLAEMGLLGVIFPQEYGGAGLGYIEYAIVLEELARVDGSIAFIISSHTSLCANHIYRFGREAQRREYLVPLARGEKLGCWALTEPDAGSDAAGTRTTAERRDDVWVLNGAKTFITSGRQADVCVAMAVTDRSKGPQGISAFIVEKGTAGFWPGKSENKLGMRASDTSELLFVDCHVPFANLIPPEGNGLIQGLQVLDGGRISMGALAVGMAQGAYETALRYAQKRKQFGKAISEFQAIRIKLADMATQIEAARLLVYRAAWRADRNMRFTKEASMAKLFASEVAVRVAGEAVQILGGYGFIKDYPAEKYYRDVRLCTIGEGTSEIQRLVIARQLLMRGSVARPEARPTQVGEDALAEAFPAE